MAECEHRIDEALPVFEGHFPGNPLLPGVMLLDHLLSAMRAADPSLDVAEIADARFLKPLRPGQRFTLSWEQREQDLRFRCESEGFEIARGRVRLRTETDS